MANARYETNASQFNIDRTYPGRWTIEFSNPPINMFVPTTIVELGALMSDLEADPSVKVIVFRRRILIFSSPILTWPEQLNGQRHWVCGATCAAPLVHASREHRQDSRAHARYR